MSDPAPTPVAPRSTEVADWPSDGVAILGTGAMACLFASRLVHRRRVTLVGTWHAQVERIAREGLEVIETDGRHTRHAVAAVADPGAVGPAALILVQVKGPATERAARWARRILDASPAGGDGLVLSLQNGLGHLEELERAVGPRRSAQGVTEQAAHAAGLGIVRHAAGGPTWLAGRPATLSRLEAVAALFAGAGLPTRITEDAAALIWGKLVVNSAINPLTALLDVPNGFLVESPVAHRLMRRAAEETAAVARAQGIHLPFEDAGKRAEEVCRATAANRSSMLQDHSRGAPTEIDSICGEVVEHGRRLGIATPVNELLWRRLGETAGSEPPGEGLESFAAELDGLMAGRGSK